jgi:threonine dehydratase
MASVKGLELAAFERARERIGPHVETTPARRIGEGPVWLKCENRQQTGSFKIRGALNKVLGLPQTELARGVVAASAGNHGQGVALAAKMRGARATIVVPAGAVRVKVDRIRALGAELVFAEGDYGAAEAKGRRLALQRGAAWISPYNDVDVIAGQGTIALELVEQLGLRGGPVWEVYVPASGGGLICGIGLGLKAAGAPVRVIGVQPEAAPYLKTYFEGGDVERVVETPTIADGHSGAVEAGSVTFALLRDAVDEFVLVSEEEIWEAMGWADREAQEVIEPSGAVALAACLAGRAERRVAVLSGGNVDPAIWAKVQGGGSARVDDR